MSERPLVFGGVAALVVGGLLLVLGLDPGRGGAATTSTSSVTRVTEPGAGIAPALDLSRDTVAQPTDAPVTPEPSATDPSAGTPLGAGSSPSAAAASKPTASSPSASSSTVSGVRVEVPAIDLDIAVRAGGVGASGRVVPPAGRATWVRGFDRVPPGAVGTAVVAGHVEAHGKRDVFADLSSVRVGHEVVVRSGSVVRTYAVTRVSVVDKARLTRDAQVWGENDRQRRLVLITCDDDLGYREDGHRVANYVVVAEAT